MKSYYVTCIVVRANQEMTFRNDIIEYEELTAKNVMQFRDKVQSIIQMDASRSKILNVVVSAFSVLAD